MGDRRATFDTCTRDARSIGPLECSVEKRVSERPPTVPITHAPLPRAAHRQMAAPDREDRRLSRKPSTLRSGSDRAAAGEECFDGDFAVGGGDFAAVYAAWGRTAAQMTTDADRACDVNADGIIDNADVSAVLSAWGRGGGFGGWGGPAGVAAGFGYGFGAILSGHFVINEVDAYYRGQAESLAASTCSGHAFCFNGRQRDIYTMLRDNRSSCDTFGDEFLGGIRVGIGEIYEQFRN